MSSAVPASFILVAVLIGGGSSARGRRRVPVGGRGMRPVRGSSGPGQSAATRPGAEAGSGAGARPSCGTFLSRRARSRPPLPGRAVRRGREGRARARAPRDAGWAASPSPEDVLGEPEGEQGARRILRDPPGARVVDGALVELADGRAMAALHVVGEDLELRLGVDLRVRRQQEIVVALARVGVLRVPMDQHPPVEHPPTVPVEEPLVDLLAGPPGLAMVHPGMEVDVLSPAGDVEPVEDDAGPGPLQGHVDPVAHEPPSELDGVRSETAPGRHERLDVPGVPGGSILLEQQVVLDLGPLADRDAGERIGELRASAGSEVVLDDRRPGVLCGLHQDDRVARHVGFAPGHEHELDRPIDPRAAPDRDHRPVAEEGPVEVGERIPAPGAGEERLHALGLRFEDPGEGVDPEPLRKRAVSVVPRRHEPSVEEDGGGGRFESGQPALRRDCRCAVPGRFGLPDPETKRAALDGSDTGVLPVLVPRGGEARAQNRSSASCLARSTQPTPAPGSEPRAELHSRR